MIIAVRQLHEGKVLPYGDGGRGRHRLLEVGARLFANKRSRHFHLRIQREIFGTGQVKGGSLRIYFETALLCPGNGLNSAYDILHKKSRGIH